MGRKAPKYRHGVDPKLLKQPAGQTFIGECSDYARPIMEAWYAHFNDGGLTPEKVEAFRERMWTGGMMIMEDSWITKIHEMAESLKKMDDPEKRAGRLITCLSMDWDDR